MLARPGLPAFSKSCGFVSDAPVGEARPLPPAMADEVRVARGLFFLAVVSLDQDPSPAASVAGVSSRGVRGVGARHLAVG
eukprot:6758524-Lingulodinium_polyedra.AAC.1